MKVLMIDDDEDLGDALRPVLERYGITLLQAATPHVGLEHFQRDPPDVLLLDMMLPDMDGMSVCRHVRSSTNETISSVPIVALSARADLTDRVAGLESGIDDYIAKPVEVRELIARLRAISRKRSHELPVQEQEIHLDEARLECFWAGRYIQLTALEMQIVRVLVEAKGIVLGRAEILGRIGQRDQADLTTVDAIVYRIRKKIRNGGAARNFIHTVRGRGYCI